MSGRSFTIGDAVSFSERKQRWRGVIVSHHREDRTPKCVVFNPSEAFGLRGGIYAHQRGWYLDVSYIRRRIKLTDEEEALAMRILLTGYVPGVDDNGMAP